MKIARDLMLEMLEAASPALGTARNLVPGLSHFWFDSDGITAFNDVLGIRVTFDSEFTGGVEGERLLGLLKNSTTKNVTLVARTGGRTPVLHVEIGSTGVTLPMRPVTESLFQEKFPEKRAVVVSDNFVDALKLVMLSCVSKKLASPAERGVTLIQTDDTIDLYTTDNVTVSTARVEDCRLFPTPDRAIWPREFCDYFVKHFSYGGRVAMTGNAVFCIADADVTRRLTVMVYAKLIEDNTPADFAGFVSRHEGQVAVAFKVPDDLPRALSRAAAMVPEKSPIEIEVTTVDPDTRVLRLYSNSGAGEFDDLIEVEANGHDDLTVKADVVLIRRALAGRTSIALTRGSVVLTGPPGFFHFISTMR